MIVRTFSALSHFQPEEGLVLNTFSLISLNDTCIVCQETSPGLKITNMYNTCTLPTRYFFDKRKTEITYKKPFVPVSTLKGINLRYS